MSLITIILTLLRQLQRSCSLDALVKSSKTTRYSNYASYGGLVLSFTTNFTSMLLIAITAWSVIQQAFERVFNAQRCF